MIKTLSFPIFAEFSRVELSNSFEYCSCPFCYFFIDPKSEIVDNEFIYCPQCHIIFDICCVNMVIDPTKYYSAKLVSEYTNENGDRIQGMPVFESIESLQESLSFLDPKFVCVNKNCAKN